MTNNADDPTGAKHIIGGLLNALDAKEAAASPTPDAGLVEREAIKKLIEIHRALGVEYDEMCEAQPNNHQNKMVLAGKRNSIQDAINVVVALLSKGVAREPVAWPDIPDDDADFTPDLARKIIAKYQSLIPSPSGRDPALTPAMRRLIVAARNVAFDRPTPDADAMKELDAASEAFAAAIPWESAPAAQLTEERETP